MLITQVKHKTNKRTTSLSHNYRKVFVLNSHKRANNLLIAVELLWIPNDFLLSHCQRIFPVVSAKLRDALDKIPILTVLSANFPTI